MPISRLRLAMLLSATLSGAAGQEGTPNVLRDGVACRELNHIAYVYATHGLIAEAEGALSADLPHETGGAGGTCVGVLLNNLAAVALLSGRAADAEHFAERAINVLEKSHPSNDPLLLRPLRNLAASRFEQGKTGRAREAFERMRLIPTERPEERAEVHSMAAVLLHVGGKLMQAESEYRAALNALEQGGLADTADAAAILNSLGTLYIEEKRFKEARQALDRGLVIFESAQDAVPMDRIKLLDVRATLHAREGHWQDALRDLGQAVSLLDASAGRCDPKLAAATMEGYAMALRKTHQGHDARVIAARAAALRGQGTPGVVVDVTELHEQAKSNSYREGK
jgi:tetratricopeptide (TPR) repeat protein